MATGGSENSAYEPVDDLMVEDDDDKNKTQPFQLGEPGAASTPYRGEEIEMQTRQHKKSGPDTSYDETTPLLAESPDNTERRLKKLRDEEIERRLNALRNLNTGLLDMTKIELQTTIFSEEDKEKEIQKVKDLIKAQYPRTKVETLMMENLNQIMVEGPKGGETKITLEMNW